MRGDQLVHNFTVTIPANADLSASQFCACDIVNASGVGQVALAAAGGRAVGVIYGVASAQGQPVEVISMGPIACVKFGGSVTAGDNLKTDSSGRYVTAAAADAAIGAVVGVALESGSVNELRKVLLQPTGSQLAITGGNEIVAASGAISLLTRTTYLQVDATKAYTLGNGLYDGQRKTIRAITATNTPAGTVTSVYDTDGTGTTAALFNAIADQIDLEWDTAISKWRVLANVSVTLS
jgi:hypothetical protein